jgi:hypothetical protein
MKSRVEELIGIDEQALIKTTDRSRFIRSIDDLKYFVDKNDNLTPIGDFNEYTINELKRMIKCLHVKEQHNSKIDITVKTKVDIAILQATIKTTDHAMVQIASNFNCLEGGSIDTFPDCGNLVETAHTDSTQGPAACFGPLAAYLYRAHFVMPDYMGQTRFDQINLLSNVEEYLGKPINGKSNLTGIEKPVTDIDELVGEIKIGLHRDAAIIYARNNKKFDAPYETVDQLLTASFNLNRHSQQTTRENLENIVRTTLRASYEGTYLSAIYRQTKTLYLTLVGGGSFMNPTKMILEEMQLAHSKWANHKKSKLENVILCVYPDKLTYIDPLPKIKCMDTT